MVIFLIFLIGLFIGSFLEVLADRIPRKENVIKGRSHCEKCKKELGILDLIPVISYLFLKGKCRYCKTKLSVFYPISEIATGLVFSLIYVFLGTQGFIWLIYYFVIAASLIVIFLTDLKYGIIPDRILFLSSFFSFLFLLFFQRNLMINHLFSASLSFSFFIAISYLFYLATKKVSMGGGDIKLAFFLGLVLGFPGIIVCLYLAFLTGAAVSIILISWRKKSFQKDSLPFGPFLILGALISFFFGNTIFFQTLKILGIF